MTVQDRPKFTYLGHATIRGDMPDGKVMLIDPWVQGNPACPDELKEFERLDAMRVTHAHFDHIGDAVELAQRYEPQIVVANFETCHWLESKGVQNTSAMNIGGSQEVLGCKVTMVRPITPAASWTTTRSSTAAQRAVTSSACREASPSTMRVTRVCSRTCS